MTLKNIIFVDDDMNITNGIKRSLRRERDKWRTFYAVSGREALQIMEQNQIDLIVTDMLMPDMRGDELLQQVSEYYPATVRIILSGYADEATLKNAMRVAHQYLSKPCSLELLKETIAQVFKIQSCIYNPLIINSLGDINQLPSLPSIYHELKQEISNPNSTSQSIADIFTHDIALSAKLLQLVNSSYFGLNRKVSNLVEAVNLIGITQVTSLVLNTFIKESFAVHNSKYSLYLDSISSNSLRTAALAKKISFAENQQEDRPDQAYLGALLHNMGLLIFMSKLPEKFDMLLTELEQSNTPVIELEKQIFGFTHAEAGAYVLGLWKIPPRVIESILLQFSPYETEYNGVNALTAVHVSATLLKPATPQINDRLFDMHLDTAYLERIGKLDRLPTWEKLAKKVAQHGD